MRLSLRALLLPAVVAASLYGADKKVEPLSPKDGVLRLFNGKDLAGLSTWLKDSKREDPRKVFTVDRKDFETYRVRRGHRHYPMEIVS